MRLLKETLLFLIVGLFAGSVFAQPISGTKTVCSSGCDYTTLASAITALNTNGVAFGGASIVISNGHTETIPSGGYSLGSLSLNTSLSASSPLEIRKDYSLGFKPVFTSVAGVGAVDAMFKLLGADYVTLDNLKFIESSSNSTATTLMEMGIALLKRTSTSPFDGCQNNIISNCEVHLTRVLLSHNTTGIFLGNHTSTSTSPLTIVSLDGTNSYNLLRGNTVVNAQAGIGLTGFNVASAPFALFDQGNIIGDGNGGNNILRFSPINSLSGYGITAQFQNNLEVVGNLVNGGLASQTQPLTGIQLVSCARALVKGNVIEDTTGSSTSYGIFCGTGSPGKIYIDSNFITRCLGGSGQMVGIAGTGTDSLFIINNTIAYNKGNAGTSLFSAGIQVTGVSGKHSRVERNQIFGNRQTNNFLGIYLMGNGNDYKVFDNEIYHDSANVLMAGIYQAATSASNDSIVGNHIYGLKTLVNGNNYGFYRFSSTLLGGKRVISKNLIHDLSTKLGNIRGVSVGYYSGQVFIGSNQIYGFRSDSINTNLVGIEVGTNTNTAYLTNNVISDFGSINSPLPTNISGIYFSSSNTANIAWLFHNTIYFDDLNSGNLISACVRVNQLPQVEMRNNILINRSLAVANGFAAAYYREGSSLTSYRLGSNNNLFYAQGTPGRSYLFTSGLSMDSTLAQYKARMFPRESESFIEDVLFNNITSAPYQLIPYALLPTKVESGANNIDTPIVVNVDVEGNLRNRRYPDIGAYEANFILSDSVPPSMYYTIPTGQTPYMAAPIIMDSIYDRFGIRYVVANSPKLYFKKKSENNVLLTNTSSSNGWKYVTSMDTVSPFRFQINYALLSSLVQPNDTIQFFAIALDSNGNYGTGTAILNSQANNTLLLAGAFPVTGQIPFFTLSDTLNGVYTVGTGGNFPSLTAALKRFQSSVITGPVEFRLTNSAYWPVSSGGLETFPINIYPGYGMNISNGLTIKPAPGVNAVIFGSTDTSGLIVIRGGTRNVTIDGSNNGSNSRNLSIHNTHVNARCNVFICSPNFGGGIEDVVVKNTKLKGGNISTTQSIVIGSSTGITPASTGTAYGVDNVVIQNCLMYNNLVGVMAVGQPGFVINNLNLKENVLSCDTSLMKTTWMGFYLEGVNRPIIDRNLIYNMETSANKVIAGVFLNSFVTGARISNNIIRGFKTFYSGTSGAYGINIGSDLGVLNDTIYNNSISDIVAASDGNGSGINYGSFGIRLAGGTNIKMYHNSVNLSGNTIYGSGPSNTAALLICYVASGYNGIDIRNNIFSNYMSHNMSGSMHRALFLHGVLPSSGFIFNYNNFYTSGPFGYLFDNVSFASNNLADLKSVTNSNANSVSINPSFVSMINLMPNEGNSLRIGLPIGNLNRDILDTARNMVNPRLGCYESEYDFYPPQFLSFVPSFNSGIAPSYTLAPVSLMDTMSGVDLSAGKRPRVYFKKATEANIFGANTSGANGWKWVECTGNASPYSFTLNYALLNSPLAINDSIYYFFVAQDSAANYAALPSAGFIGTGVAAISSAPSIPYRFRVVAAPLNGTYTVGTGGNFPSITAAVLDLHARGASGPVNFMLTQTTYTSPQETFPITFNNNIVGLSDNNRVSFRSANGISVSIVGSTQSIFRFNGAKYITINGANTVTQAGRLISIRNTSSNSTLLFENDASFNHIRNVNVYGESFDFTKGIVHFGERLVTGNDSNWVDSCFIGPISTSWPMSCVSAYTFNYVNNVYSEGNVLSNNEIANPRMYGMYLVSDNSEFLVKGNSFYRSSNYFTQNVFSFICISDARGYNTIQNNYFGGSAAYCGGANYSVIETNEEFNFIKFQGNNYGKLALITGNQFRRIQINTTKNSNYHSLITVLNGKVRIANNTIGNDTGVASIQFHYNNPVASARFNLIDIGAAQGCCFDTVDIWQNNFGAVSAFGNGDLELIAIAIGGSSGKVIVRENGIGSATKMFSMSQHAQGNFYGIKLTSYNQYGYANILDNRISNLRFTNSLLKELHGIFIGGTVQPSIIGNRVYNLFHQPLSPNIGMPNYSLVFGIFSSSNSNQVIPVNNNVVHSLHSITNPSAGAVGITVGAYVGQGYSVNRNKIYALHSIGGGFARQIGLNMNGTVTATNNEISLGTDSLGTNLTNAQSYKGIYRQDGPSNIFFNSVVIMGSGVDTATNATSSAFNILNYTSSDSVFNNVFYNGRSNFAAGSNVHRALEMDYGTSIKMNRNLLFAGGVGGVLAKVSGANYNTLLAYTSATGFDLQSKSKQLFFVGANNLRLTGSSLGDYDLAALPLSNLGSDKDFVTRNSSHPYMGCYEGNVALPVSYLFFKGNVIGQDAVLNWVTAVEQSNKGFFVRRSKDGINFETVGFVAGKGNSNRVNSYSFVNDKAFEFETKWYYQLQQLDENGHLASTEFVVLSKDFGVADYSVFPNPASAELFITLPANTVAEVQLSIYDLQGKLVQKQAFSFGLNQLNKEAMNISKLPNGVYVYRLESGQEQLLYGKFVKE